MTWWQQLRDAWDLAVTNWRLRRAERIDDTLDLDLIAAIQRRWRV